MELILPGHCGSLLPALHLVLPPVYMEPGVDNVFASLMRVPQRDRGQWRVKPRTTSHLGLQPGTPEMLSAAAAESTAAALRSRDLLGGVRR